MQAQPHSQARNDVRAFFVPGKLKVLAGSCLCQRALRPHRLRGLRSGRGAGSCSRGRNERNSHQGNHLSTRAIKMSESVSKVTYKNKRIQKLAREPACKELETQNWKTRLGALQLRRAASLEAVRVLPAAPPLCAGQERPCCADSARFFCVSQ